MVAIRLRRAGSKKRPFFRIVVADSRGACDSSFVEILGHYNPRTKPAIVTVDAERVQHWLKHGAQPSDSVRTLLARHLTPVAAQPAAAVSATPAAAAPAPAADAPSAAPAPAVAAAESAPEPPASEAPAQ
jgi:small subunit ribosomal protein S16